MLRKALPVLALIFLILIVVATNISPTHFLLGWDNLVPELNFKLNLQRAIFSVWEEYQGLGLLAGNGHAADLPRQILLIFSSIILPLNLIRQFYVFLMLGVGTLGAYSLVKFLIPSKSRLLAFLGGSFYLLNLVTVQTFFVPFEPMIAHYAFLPWLVFAFIYYLKNHTKKALAIFVGLNFIAIPQSQVPTMFLVYLIVVGIIALTFILKEKTKAIFKRSTNALGLIFVINAFWFLPFFFFVYSNIGVALNAKINQMTTENVLLQNKAFGDIPDVMLLKGFWFNNVDPDINSKFAYMMIPWRNYFDINFVPVIGFALFGIVFLGILRLTKTRDPGFISLAVLFLVSFTMLCTDTPPFSWIDAGLRVVPIFNEVFRFPFTKFANILLLTYTVFFAGGVLWILEFLQKRLNLKRAAEIITGAVFFAMLIAFTFPVFNNQLFYYKIKLSIPNDYFKVFNYFKNQDPNTRIANLPQYTFWGWSFYNWGYGGSGFLWYGIQQPILDRAFDVWSGASENYYWELTHAIYSENPALLKNVLNKYQINFLLVDNSITKDSSQIALFLPQTRQLIAKIPEIKKDTSFGKIDIYKINLDNKPKSYVMTSKKLDSVNTYHWGEYDKAFSDLGNYISTTNVDHFYIFRSLFSSKNQEDQEYNVKNMQDYYEFSQKLANVAKGAKLFVPSISTSDKIIYAQVVQNRTKDGMVVSLLFKTPQVYVSYKNKSGKMQKIKIFGQDLVKPIFLVKQNNYGFYINVNGIKTFKAEPSVYEGQLGSTFISTTQDNVLVFSNKDAKVAQSFVLTKDDLVNLLPKDQEITLPNIPNNSTIIVDVPKIKDDYQDFSFVPDEKTVASVKNCDNFNNGPYKASLVNANNEKMIELSSNDSTACIATYTTTFTHDLSYIAFIDTQNIKGRPLHFWLLNEDEKFAPIDTFLSNWNQFSTSTFIFSPQEQYGNAYSFHFDNISIANDQTVNRLGQIKIYSLPYNFLTSMYISTNSKKDSKSQSSNLSVYHPNESLYKVSVDSKTSPQMLILSQSFNNGWKIYKVNKANGILGAIYLNFPFIFGSEIGNHVLTNNWENGWYIGNVNFNPQKQDIIIMYTPQFLEYFGFIFLGELFLWLFLTLIKRRGSSPKID